MGMGGMPPPFNGSTAKRVHSTTLSYVGSPEATPSGKGMAAGANPAAPLGVMPEASARAVRALPRRKVRLVKTEETQRKALKQSRSIFSSGLILTIFNNHHL